MMSRKKDHVINSERGIIVLSIAVALSFWIVDSLIDYFINPSETFLTVLFFEPKEVYYRTFASLAFIISGSLVAKAFSQKERVAEALHAAMKKADEEKAKTQAIMDAINDGISIQDTGLKVIYQNEAHRKMTGGDHTGGFCHVQYAKSEQVCEGCPVSLCFQDGKPHSLIKNVRRGGEILSFEINASALFDASGEIKAGIEVVRDISVRKRMDEELHRHLVAMETSMDGMAILDHNAKFVYLNSAHAGIYGYDSPRELIGRSWKVLYSEKEVNRFEGEVMPVLWEKGQWSGEATGTRRDGSTFEQEVSLTAIDGNGLVCVVRNITDRKSVEKEKEKLIDELRDALANIKVLSGLLPICASCKKIRDDKGYWNQIEYYIRTHSDAVFTHSICPDCIQKLYPELHDEG